MRLTVKSRLSSLIFLFGIISAAAVAVFLDQASQNFSSQIRTTQISADANFIAPLPPRTLTSEDKLDARRAWRYFELNTRDTGLVDSVSGFPSTTLWDQGSYLLAIIAANKLSIIDTTVARQRALQLLQSLQEITLYGDTLPNKAYNTETLQKTDYSNSVLEEGIGWSALDLARLLLALRALEHHFPELSANVLQIVRNWKLDAFANSGELWGMVDDGENASILQEGRLGYEQYGARAAALWGLDVGTSLSATRVLDWREVEGVSIPTDKRTAKSYGAITPILSEPYLLQAFELGLDRESSFLSSNIYKAQKRRFDRQKIPTMVSEDHLDKFPNFAYSSLFSNGREWAVVNESGDSYDHLRTLSTKAVFGWDALYQTPYTRQMRSMLRSLPDEDKGWQAGIYEETTEPNSVYSLNTNAVILEAFQYKGFGPFLSYYKR